MSNCINGYIRQKRKKPGGGIGTLKACMLPIDVEDSEDDEAQRRD